MAKITDGTLKSWNDTEIIHATEYVQEREILRIAVNDNDERLSSLEDSAAGLLLGNVQMTKITDDAGGAKLTVTSTSGDMLSTLATAGKGFHTFYAVGGSKNLPPTNLSIRGFAHFESNSNGFVYATDYENNIFTNYYTGGKNEWSGWRHLVSDKDTQTELWSGASYMAADANITPSKKLTDCRNGWIFVWSDYNPGSGPGDWDFNYSYVPKFIGTKHNGSIHLFPVPRTPDATIVKSIRIYNDRITGDATNSQGDDNDVALRYVLEW